MKVTEMIDLSKLNIINGLQFVRSQIRCGNQTENRQLV